MNQALTSEKKKRLWMDEKEKEMSSMLVDTHHKLYEAKAQVEMVTQEGMVVYKATKLCHNDQISTPLQPTSLAKTIFDPKW